jgi:hypothetical protein
VCEGGLGLATLFGEENMKPVPKHIIANGPPGTEWFGGAVDRSTMTLRVGAKTPGKSVDKKEVSRLLGCESDQEQFRHWSLHAPDSEEADLDSQVGWILSRLTTDLTIWKNISSSYRVDLFCALHLERPNRGATLAPKIMAELGARGIELGFDIYAPEEPNQSPKQKRTSGHRG